MKIDSITINLKNKEPIEINKVTDLRTILLDYDEDDEFIVTNIEIDYNNEDITISATPTERDVDELEELIETLYELFDYDLAELYEQLPSVAQENLSVSEWMPHDENSTTSTSLKNQPVPFARPFSETFIGRTTMYASMAMET